jgi:hypothetical protein
MSTLHEPSRQGNVPAGRHLRTKTPLTDPSLVASLPSFVLPVANLQAHTLMAVFAPALGDLPSLSRKWRKGMRKEMLFYENPVQEHFSSYPWDKFF